MATNGLTTKPSVLIVGGLGCIGRHLAYHIHSNNLTSHYRLVDKVLPQLAHLAPEHTTCCSPPYFLQADASNAASLPRIFAPPDGEPATFTWDYIINLGGETSWSQSPEVYAARTTQMAITLAREAATRHCKAFIEVSTGIVYKSSREPSNESAPLKPWLALGKAKLDAEAALSRIPALPLVILRLAHVYGAYNTGFSSKFLSLARVYQEQQRGLKWLWTEELRVNSVWVGDVVRAIMAAGAWRAGNDVAPVTTTDGSDGGAARGAARRPTLLARVTSMSVGGGGEEREDEPLPGTPVFNIVDHGATCQGTLAALTGQVFGIKTGFQGSLISQFAKLNLESVVDDLNDEILQPWAEMLERKGLRSGKLSPFLEKELLGDKELSMDGGLFERVVGFEYERETLGRAEVEEMVESYRRMGWWP